MCDEGVTELAITRPLLDDGTVMQHTVVNSTVTYTLQGKTIKWTNNKVPECDGYAYPSTPTKLLQNMYSKRARTWIGSYHPMAGGNRRQCCIPELISISHTNNNFGILISLKKEDHDSRCFFKNTLTTIHQITTLVPQGNTITKMADGQPLRFIHNGDTMLLDQPANEGCDGIMYRHTEKISETSDPVEDGDDDEDELSVRKRKKKKGLFGK